MEASARKRSQRVVLRQTTAVGAANMASRRRSVDRVPCSKPHNRRQPERVRRFAREQSSRALWIAPARCDRRGGWAPTICKEEQQCLGNVEHQVGRKRVRWKQLIVLRSAESFKASREGATSNESQADAGKPPLRILAALL